MDTILSTDLIRVLGCMIEKERATPEYYPLTINQLMNACNQKSNRDPVMEMDSRQIEEALDQLREIKLVSMVMTADGRVPKFKQLLVDLWSFSPQEAALLCELFVRGPQTPNELKNRASRLHPFSEVSEILHTINELETRPGGPFMVKLSRQPGQKESRYAHLFAGPIKDEVQSGEPVVAPVKSPGLTDRVQALETEVAELKQQIRQLQEALGVVPSSSATNASGGV